VEDAGPSHELRRESSDDPQRERTAGGMATTTGGPGNGDIDIEALAVRATHCG
jgi:hypothetical protein